MCWQLSGLSTMQCSSCCSCATALTRRNSLTRYLPVVDLAGRPSFSFGEISSHRYSPFLRLFCTAHQQQEFANCSWLWQQVGWHWAPSAETLLLACQQLRDCKGSLSTSVSCCLWAYLCCHDVADDSQQPLKRLKASIQLAIELPACHSLLACRHEVVRSQTAVLQQQLKGLDAAVTTACAVSAC